MSPISSPSFDLIRTDDVKCLHAHTADELLRGRNRIGKAVLDKLQSRGVDPSGCQGDFIILLTLVLLLLPPLPSPLDCWQQCDLSVSPEEAKWWYTSEKSRSKLIKRKLNRKRQKESQRHRKNEESSQ
jgi:hypothetical protein